MSVTKTISDRFLLERGKGTIDFFSDTFKAILMDTGFTFDKENHGELLDVEGNEIGSGNGYTQQDITLTTDSAWAVSNNEASISWNDLHITADGGNIQTFKGVIIYDDSHTDNVILGYIDLGESVSLEDGMSLILNELGYDAQEKE